MTKLKVAGSIAILLLTAACQPEPAPMPEPAPEKITAAPKPVAHHKVTKPKPAPQEASQPAEEAQSQEGVPEVVPTEEHGQSKPPATLSGTNKKVDTEAYYVPFEHDKAVPTEFGQKMIGQIVEELKASTTSYEIVLSTRVGKPSDTTLSTLRGLAVEQKLVEGGIDAATIHGVVDCAQSKEKVSQRIEVFLSE